MKIEIEVSTETEATSSPWWAIIDPRQNFNVDEYGVHNLSSMITGVFFSREEANEHLKARRHAFSKNARVFCFSGCWSGQYDKAYRKAFIEHLKNEKREQ